MNPCPFVKGDSNTGNEFIKKLNMQQMVRSRLTEHILKNDLYPHFLGWNQKRYEKTKNTRWFIDGRKEKKKIENVLKCIQRAFAIEYDMNG